MKLKKKIVLLSINIDSMKTISSFLFSFFCFSMFSQTTLTTAMNFYSNTIDGQYFDLFETLDDGQHVLVDFFYVDCVPCQAMAPSLQSAYERYGCNNADVFFLSVNLNDNSSQITQFENAYGVHIPVIEGAADGYLINLLYDIQSYPSTVLIAPDRSILNQTINPFSSGVDAAMTSAGVSQNQAACSFATSVPLIKVFSDLKIFVNASNLQVNLTQYENNITTFEIFDLLGKRILKTQKLLFKGNQYIALNIADVPAGNYLLKVSDQKGSDQSLKFQVQ